MNIKVFLRGAISFMLIFSLTNYAQASLKDFKDGVDKSGKKKKASSNKSSKSDDSCMGDIFGDCISEIGFAMITLWVAHNLSAFYSSYPYEQSNEANFIYLDFDSKDESKKPEKPLYERNKFETDRNDTNKKSIEPLSDARILAGFDNTYFFTADIGGQWARDEGSGVFAAIGGKITRLIGAECEFKRIWDGEDYLDYYAFGLNLSLFQNDYISPDLYLQYAAMKGIVNLSGSAFGIITHSYPGNNIHLMFRIGKQYYTEQEGEELYREIDFLDLEGRIGVLFSRFELFAGYRHIETDYAELGGPIGGIRVWF